MARSPVKFTDIYKLIYQAWYKLFLTVFNYNP